MDAGNRFSDRGKDTHKVLELWERDAKPIDLSTKIGKIAWPAVARIPPPGTSNLFTEKEVLWRSPSGVLYKFQRDLHLLVPERREAFVWDYKTTSNLSFAHTREELEQTDPQGIIYPAQLFYDDPNLETVFAEWIYLSANEPFGAHPVQATHKRGANLISFGLLDQHANVMVRHRQLKTHPMCFEPNLGSCGAYGGCPYKNSQYCQVSELEQLIAMSDQQIGNNTSTFLAAVRRINATDGGPTPGAQPIVASLPAAQPVPVVAQSIGLPTPVPTMTAQTAPVTNALPWLTQAPAPAQQPVAVPAQVPPPAQGQMPLPWAPSVPPAPVAPTAQPDVPSLEVPAPEKKRTRRTKAQIEADRAAAAGPSQEAPEEEEYVEAVDASSVPAEFVAKLKIPNTGTQLENIVVAMCSNPGYSGLDSTALVAKAVAIAAALKVEQ